MLQVKTQRPKSQVRMAPGNTLLTYRTARGRVSGHGRRTGDRPSIGAAVLSVRAAGVGVSRAGARARGGFRSVGGDRLGGRLASAAARRVAKVRFDAAEEQAQVGLRSYLVCLAVAFVLAVALSWTYSTTATLGYRIDDLNGDIATLERQHEKLSYELSGYQSVARVEQEATGRLGMVRPDYVRVGLVDTSTAGPAVGLAGSQGDLATARVIELTTTGPGLAAVDAVAATPASDSERGALGSLWDRFYQWLTGVTEAEAGDWQ